MVVEFDPLVAQTKLPAVWKKLHAICTLTVERTFKPGKGVNIIICYIETEVYMAQYNSKCNSVKYLQKNCTATKVPQSNYTFSEFHTENNKVHWAGKWLLP